MAVSLRLTYAANFVQKKTVYTLTHHRHLPYFTGNQSFARLAVPG
jgi:hypothetical protein